MLINTHEDWEIDNPALKLFDPPGTRIYPFVEISINCHLFHVDIRTHPTKDDGYMPCMRFIATDIIQAFIMVDDDSVKEFSISLQSRRCDNENDEYQISSINEILQAEETCGQKVYIYICKNGKRVIDTSLGSSEDELSNIKSIYQHGKMPSSEWLKENEIFTPMPKNN